MKKTLSIIAVTAALTTAAFADVDPLQNDVERMVNGADLSVLSETERANIRNIYYSGDTFSERQRTIYSLLESAGAIDEETNGTFMWSQDQWTALEADLQLYGDYDLKELTKAEKMQVMQILYSGEKRSEKQSKIDSIFG